MRPATAYFAIYSHPLIDERWEDCMKTVTGPVASRMPESGAHFGDLVNRATDAAQGALAAQEGQRIENRRAYRAAGKGHAQRLGDLAETQAGRFGVAADQRVERAGRPVGGGLESRAKIGKDFQAGAV